MTLSGAEVNADCVSTTMCQQRAHCAGGLHPKTLKSRRDEAGGLLLFSRYSNSSHFPHLTQENGMLSVLPSGLK